jgi:hypothetical protein
MIDFRSILTNIDHGIFPNGKTLRNCRTELDDSFIPFRNRFAGYLLYHELSESQSRKLRDFIYTFFAELDHIRDASFVNLIILRVHATLLIPVVKKLSSKLDHNKHCRLFIRGIGILGASPVGGRKALETLIYYSFQTFQDETEQRSIINFIVSELRPVDSLKALVFCREHINNKSYLELSVWSILKNNDLNGMTLRELSDTIPRMTFNTIREISIVSDLSKILRVYQNELNQTNIIIATLDEKARNQLILLNENPEAEVIEDNDDMMGFYTNYHYGIK